MIANVKKKILLVENEALIAMHEIRELESRGYDVIHVLTGEDAVKTQLESGSSVDLILMDIDLGDGIDGTQAAYQILQTKDVPVVFLSSHTEPEIVEKTEKITSYGYVVKNTGSVVLDASIKMAFKLFEAKVREKEKERALEESEERFIKLFERAPLGYQSLNEEGYFSEVNEAWLEMLGYMREEVIGKWFGDFLAPEFVEAFRERFPIFKREGRIHSEFEMIHKKGQRRYIAFDGRIGRKKDGSFEKTHCILNDVTEQKRSEAVIREHQEELAAIYENAPLIMMLLDRDRRVRKINGYGTSFAGKKNDELTGMRGGDALGCLYSLDAPEGCGFGPNCLQCKVRETVLDTFETGKSSFQVEADLPFKVDGLEKRLSLLISTQKLSIRESEVVLVCIEDITGRKLAEEALKQQLQEKELLLKEVNHRIKNNISSIRSMLMLQSENVTNTESLGVLNDAISRVESIRLVYDKLSFSGVYNEMSVKNYLEDLITSIIGIFPDNDKVQQIMEIDELSLEIKRLLPIGTIVNELITNSLKYAFPDRNSAVLKIMLKNSNGTITISVQDDGIGLPEGFDISRSTGFGLMLVKMLTRQINGAFTIESAIGTTSVVSFKL